MTQCPESYPATLWNNLLHQFQGKGKVSTVNATKVDSRWRRTAPLILNLRTIWRWVVNFTSRTLYPGTHWMWGWLGPTAGLKVFQNRKISCPCRDTNPGSPSPYPSPDTDYVVSDYKTEEFPSKCPEPDSQLHGVTFHKTNPDAVSRLF
jgi:hypothetical protein